MTSAALHRRLFSRNAALQLARNTVVSCVVFSINLLLLWLLVEQGGMDKILAAAVAFIIANSFNYLFGRWWIFRGTERKAVSGFVYVLVNAGVGLTVTIVLFAIFLALFPAWYLLDRVIVSVVSGLTVFVLNAVFNFRTV